MDYYKYALNSKTAPHMGLVGRFIPDRTLWTNSNGVYISEIRFDIYCQLSPQNLTFHANCDLAYIYKFQK